MCDQPGDKGVDGIFVNDNNQTITIFQSRIYQRPDATVGDAPLREFTGTLTQFDTAPKIEALIAAAGNAQVARLARKLDLVNKIATHELRGEFVTNLDMDANGRAFIDATPQITFVGKTALNTSYISDSSRDTATCAPIVRYCRISGHAVHGRCRHKGCDRANQGGGTCGLGGNR